MRSTAGQTISGVAFSAPKPAPASPAAPAALRRLRGGGSGKVETWVKGTVRDESGTPIANASVMALGTYFGGMRMNQVTSKTTTDADGNYEIRGEGGLTSFSATVIAAVAGRPPAWAWPAFDGQQPAVQDFVIPSKSGSLDITVLQKGRPAPEVHVAVYLENADLHSVWALPTDDASAVQNLAYPTAKTDALGVAAFRNLLPGRYRMVASTQAHATRLSLSGIRQLAQSTVESIGVPVRIGETTSFTLNLFEQNNSALIQVMQVDGRPYTGRADISFGPADTIAWSSSLEVNTAGVARRFLDRAGLWKMNVKFLDPATGEVPVAEPYYLASGHVAASPNLAGDHVPVLTARLVKPGSVRIKVLDFNGKPCQVTIQAYNGLDQFSGTTDENGQIVFTGLTSERTYYIALSSSTQTNVTGSAEARVLRPVGVVSADHDIRQGPWPQPNQLAAEPAILATEFIAESNAEVQVTMRPVLRRYVYGVLRGSGARNGPWAVSVESPMTALGASARNWSTGEYVAGPFPPGERQLTIFSSNGEGCRMPLRVDATSRDALRLDIEVSQCKFEPSNAPAAIAAKPATTMLGMGGISSQAGGASQLQGKVILADGATPAFGAQVLYWHARDSAPSLFAMSDALGVLKPRGLWRAGSGPEPSSGTSSATVIAFLPGSTGATVKTVSRPDDLTRLVLPPPISLVGRVTVGGLSPVQRPGTIRVIAAHQGRGFLDPYLSVTSTAGADGAFELAGLTPGNYEVQAALDDIWLSAPLNVRIGDAAPTPLALAIPAPGVSVRLEIRDASDQPVPGASVTLERVGPLAKLWPATWIADGAGRISIPTLEAGSHTIHSARAVGPIRFEVPPLPGGPVTFPVSLR